MPVTSVRRNIRTVVGVVQETSKGEDENKNDNELDTNNDGVEESRLTDTIYTKKLVHQQDRQQIQCTYPIIKIRVINMIMTKPGTLK